MPGISLVRDVNDIDRSAIDGALEAVRFFDDYGTERWYDGERTVVGSTGYDGYPTRVTAVDGGVVVFEGELYGADDVVRQLQYVGSRLLAGNIDPLEAWLLARDGDFLIAAIDEESGRTRVVTDPLGRLPVYIATIGSATVLSRELKFLREYADAVGDPLEIDRLGVAQTLQFGYRLGTRTLFDGVQRLGPAEVVTIDDGVEVDTLHRHDFGQTPQAAHDLKTNVAELANRFVAACRARATRSDDTVVALSGGLDSRAVAAGLATSDEPFRARTFDRPDGTNVDEVRAARRVADELGIPWTSQVASASDRHRERLLEMKQGMNYLRLSYLLDFLEDIDGDRARTTLVTGDGGDKVLPDLTPTGSTGSMSELVQDVLSHNRIFATDVAAEVAGIPEHRLVDSIRDRLRSYPETDPAAMYVHFLVRERGMNWLFHGEDRNRYYYWSVSPFYAWPVFWFAMGIPASQKSAGRLQKRFLSELAPELLDVEYVNFGAPITSTEYRVKRAVYDTLVRYPIVGDAAIGLLKRIKGDPTVDNSHVVGEVRRKVLDADPLGETFPSSSTDRIAENLDSYSTPALYHLLTIAELLVDETPGELSRSGGVARTTGES